MKTVAFVAAAMLTLGSGSAAIAGERAAATLKTPVLNDVEVIVDGRLWRCEEDKCTSGSQGENQPVPRECARAAKVLGPVSSYRRGNRVLNTQELEACNATAATALTARAVRGTNASARVGAR